jgi:ubiquinone/menaquinone biosynthesis C-methylase UbiE
MEEVRRLELQMKALESEIESEIKILGITSGTKVLDAGCGTGGFSRRIAGLVSPARIYAIDSDSLFVAEAKKLARREGVGNVYFTVGDLSQTVFEDSTFDLAYCRLVLHHLRDSRKAMRELKRVTRDGGRIASVDEGGSYHHPQMPKFLGLFGKVAEWRKSTGGHTPNLALQQRDALAVFQEAGLTQVKAYPMPTFGTQKDPKHLRRLVEVPMKMLEVHKKAAIDEGFMTETEYASGVKECEMWLSRPDSFWMILSILTVGRVGK